ncbi:DUF6457 domain-containing protein [Nesterenkonia cremea]|uniref:DUF6457 domain-containing protein n=1 Tax=Nesterenkonia cremea TaxID=1882340 RepID=A0A917ATD7_9MICC|nr:DUF6457 domain-containing protein [Nesterenkonia cremea]GGE73973.1 hypothetical protein GCM10011401_21510 [Nesterenkonia cremea]
MAESNPLAEGPQKTEQQAAREAIDLWVRELTHHLEIEDVEIDIDALLKLAGQAAHTIVRPSAPITTFLVGYVTGLAEASGQADYTKAVRAASRVAEQLLERRSQAVG